MVDRVPEELWTKVHNIVQEVMTKTIPKKKQCKKAKWLSEKALQIAEERGEVKKKDLNDPDNDDGMITHLEPDIPECKVKWALGSITTNKAGGGDRITAELFKILNDDAVKVLHSICQQI